MSLAELAWNKVKREVEEESEEEEEWAVTILLERPTFAHVATKIGRMARNQQFHCSRGL